MELFQSIEERRTIRKFLDKQVDPDVVHEIIRLGTLAPTACNRQGWRFIIFDNKDEMRKLVTLKGGAKFIPDAPVGIMVLYHKYSINPFYEDNAESGSACIQNMLLAASHYGLGGCWVNNLPPKPYLHRVFKIPKQYDIIAYVALGYPVKKLKPVRRKYASVDELISYNHFHADTEIEERKPRSAIGMSFVLVSAFLVSKLPTFLQRLLPSKLSSNLRKLVKIDHPFPEEYDNLSMVEYQDGHKKP
ncbi:MAG: nitroreductase family protein [Spirochaetales bacterium]|jgi:nitroreductase|nr:nitroreductase family protein [Spirochaetales bacterium]